MTHRKSEIYIDKCAHLFVILLQIISYAYSYLYSLCFYGYNIITEHSVIMSPYLEWIVTHSKLIIKDSICH